MFATTGIAYSVMQVMGTRHTDRNVWFFLLYQLGSSALLSQYILAGYIWTRTFLRTHGISQFLWCSLSKSTNLLLTILWLSQTAISVACFCDTHQYRLLAEISVGISWGMTITVVLSVLVSATSVNAALRKLRAEQTKLVGRAFHRIRVSWLILGLAGVPALVILPCFVLQVSPVSEYMYICFNVVLTNASLATVLILFEFRRVPPDEIQTVAEKSLTSTVSEGGSTVIVSPGVKAVRSSQSTPHEGRIDQELD